MGLLEKLKSFLGLDSAGSATTGGNVDVTVEREPATESEDAVKGTETAGTDLGAGGDGADAREAAETEDSDETVVEAGSMADTTAESETGTAEDDATPIEEAEPAPSTEIESESETPGASDAETEPAVSTGEASAAENGAADAPGSEAEPGGTEATADAVSEARDVEGDDDPVTDIKGIGPAYAERLAGLGIETVGDLAAADAGDIADQTDLAEKRVAGWIERARE